MFISLAVKPIILFWRSIILFTFSTTELADALSSALEEWLLLVPFDTFIFPILLDAMESFVIKSCGATPVSYTHLTLPTILLV